MGIVGPPYSRGARLLLGSEDSIIAALRVSTNMPSTQGPLWKVLFSAFVLKTVSHLLRPSLRVPF